MDKVQKMSQFQLTALDHTVCVHPTAIIFSPRMQQIAFKSRVDQYICQSFPISVLNGISEKKGNKFQRGVLYKLTDADTQANDAEV